ncbi:MULTISPECIES: protein-L-isoaspartate(D-aspartate) O-methyltransferase [unclassified Rhizobium]|uniref:protein-L-isoaspartate(D-aspartate) O-methyltransferase n=1 Tax=unclassified Rhizobium TaxID=2613769 RepID=UPI001602BF06|nr:MULTISPECIES: protein-L-isoaspartate(D-aspartate) O-methyltransferase [unclassified Rhizobium]MBB1247957.1 protein-L-isoaspartate(D-aspartate) O-methyltransferase [Rhizobium sp. G21]MCV3765246.1 protein-L-isoaspartate(D-aspartate) O-methyltransferase [Rhizobium sp. TRM95796]
MPHSVSSKEGFAALCLRLRAKGVTSAELLNAIEQTPRHLFVPSDFISSAWSSRTLPIECGAVMEGVDLAAVLIDLLKLKPSHRVLEIGTGSGFTAAVMGRVAERVLTIDRYRTLVNLAQERMDKLALRNVIVRQADGNIGLQGEGTFDRILITAGFSAFPRIYAEQLVSGGVMLAPVLGEDGVARMIRLVKAGSRFEREDLFETPFQPIVQQVAQTL